MKQLCLTILIFGMNFSLVSQVKIGTDASRAHASSMLEVQSDSLGLMLPKITSANLSRIQNAKGLLSAHDASGKLMFFSSAGWEEIASNGINGNVFLGDSAGYNVTTGVSNIAIGKKAQIYRPTYSNQLTIGNVIFGTGLSESPTSIGNGNIGIGLNNPLTKLHVKGTVTTEKINIVTGSNAGLGFVDLVNGVANVSNTRTTSSSLVLFSPQGALNGKLYIDSKTSGVGFVIKSTDTSDQLTIGYILLN